jgi:hypothetical protein
MAHFAEINENNIVLRVLSVPDEEEHRGEDFLSNDLGLGGTWVQTSYTSKDGVRVNPDTHIVTSKNHFRFNFAAPGYLFDPNFGPDGAFIPPKPNIGMEIDPETAQWKEIPGVDLETGEPLTGDDLTVSNLFALFPRKTIKIGDAL